MVLNGSSRSMPSIYVAAILESSACTDSKRCGMRARCSASNQRQLELVAGLGAGLELGQADTLSFIGVVIALHLVRKSSELFGLDVRIELDVQGALPVSIAPPFTGGPILLTGRRPNHGAQLCLALADK